MYKRCITEQSARRQRELEQGLLEVMATRRYEDITIMELCSWLVIPRKAFYRYFSSKEGTLYALIDHTLMVFSVDFLAHDPAATYSTLEHFFSFWATQSNLLDALEHNELSGLLVQRAILLATDEKLFPRNLFLDHSRATREQMALFVVSGMMTMVAQWHQNRFSHSPQKMADIAAHLLTQPLVSAPVEPGTAEG